MIGRVFGAAFGLGVGLLVGAYVVRRLDDASRAVSPPTLVAKAADGAGGLGAAVRNWADAARTQAVEREAVLRERFNVPTTEDLIQGRV